MVHILNVQIHIWKLSIDFNVWTQIGRTDIGKKLSCFTSIYCSTCQLSLECLSFVSWISGQRGFPLLLILVSCGTPSQNLRTLVSSFAISMYVFLADWHYKKTEKDVAVLTAGMEMDPMMKLVVLHSAAFAPFLILLPALESALWLLQKVQRQCVGMAQSSVPGVAMAEPDPRPCDAHTTVLALCFVRYVALSFRAACFFVVYRYRGLTTAITLFFWGILEPSNRPERKFGHHNSPATTHMVCHPFLSASFMDTAY